MKILEFFHQNHHKHFSADDMHLTTVKGGMDVGVATVYRILTQFEQADLLLHNHFESGKTEGKAIYVFNEGVVATTIWSPWIVATLRNSWNRP
jgi:Fur family ferric uptake transcriptional regulator